MPFTTYVKRADITAKLDEKIVGQLGSRTGSTKPVTWEPAVIDQSIKDMSAVFESYAVNKYTLADLRVDPPPAFAVKCVLRLVLYDLYANNKRHVVPKVYKENYDEEMKMLTAFGNPQIIDAVGVIDSSASSSHIGYNRTEDDLQFSEEKQSGFWGPDN